MHVVGGADNVTTYFALRLTADGKAATGLTISGIDLQYVRSGDTPVAKVDAVALAATNTAHAPRSRRGCSGLLSTLRSPPEPYSNQEPEVLAYRIICFGAGERGPSNRTSVRG